MTLKHTDHRQPQMHKWFPLIALLLLVLASPVWADYTVDFVRISCVPDAQFLDVEYRGIHNPAITALTEHGTVRPDVLARHGVFFAKQTLLRMLIARLEVHDHRYSNWLE